MKKYSTAGRESGQMKGSETQRASRGRGVGKDTPENNFYYQAPHIALASGSLKSLGKDRISRE